MATTMRYALASYHQSRQHAIRHHLKRWATKACDIPDSSDTYSSSRSLFRLGLEQPRIHARSSYQTQQLIRDKGMLESLVVPLSCEH